MSVERAVANGLGEHIERVDPSSLSLFYKVCRLLRVSEKSLDTVGSNVPSPVDLCRQLTRYIHSILGQNSCVVSRRTD